MSDKKSSQILTSGRSKSTYSMQPSSMVSVIEEQSADDTVEHILPLPPAVLKDPINSNTIQSTDMLDNTTISNHINNQNNETEKLDQSPEVTLKGVPAQAEELNNPNYKLEKKSFDHLNLTTLSANSTGNNLSSINEMKLKKTTNPSISSLRAISLQPNNYNVSSASTTLTKGSTRAEHFAAKVHDAIKNDAKNNNDTVETFVYATQTAVGSGPSPPAPSAIVAVTTATPPIDSHNENIDSQITKDSDKNKTIGSMTSDYSSVTNDLNNNTAHKYKERLQNVFNPEDSLAYNKTLEDDFDIKSYSSMGSKKPSKRRVSRHSHYPTHHEGSHHTNEDKTSMNQLRQITSRLFDNKAVQPRRYSAIDNDYANDDLYEDDMDFYEPSFSDNFNFHNNNNNNIVNANSQHANTNTNINTNANTNTNTDANTNVKVTGNPYDFLIPQNDVEYGDELSSYLSSPNYNSNNSYQHSNNMNYLNKQPIHGNVFSTDYGSISGDKKKTMWKRSYYNSPHNFTSNRAQRLKQIKSFCYSISLVIMLLFIGFISGFILATNKELQNMKVIDVNNILISQEELVFDMIVSSFNPGLLPISIETVQLDIFAKTQYLTIDEYEYEAHYKDKVGASYETVLLGSIGTLEIPLFFEGGFLNRKRGTSQTQIKVLNPCSYDDDSDGDQNHSPGNRTSLATKLVDEDNNEGNENLTDLEKLTELIEFEVDSGIPNLSRHPDPKWLNISRHPFDLIIRGAMIYKLPLLSNNHTVSVNYISYVDPGYDDY